ncbi:SDR family oxidoreductase [soil metagenome]
MNYLEGRVILVTGAGGGFGKLTVEKAAAAGARVVCVDINGEAASAVASGIEAAGGSAEAVAADVRNIDDLRAAVRAAVSRFGSLDVLVNNAGTMPLAFLADHAQALDAWNRCIDINFKGVMNGTVAAYDQMMAQGHGHIVNIASIYANHPVVGSAVYGATKAAVESFSNSVRQETRGRIKVTVVKPTGVMATGLLQTTVNMDAAVGILGHNWAAFQNDAAGLEEGTVPPKRLDPENIEYGFLDPGFVADAIIHVINQPRGVTLSDVTVRATGDYFIM